MAAESRLTLSDGTSIPVFGLGVYEAQSNGETEQACLLALKHGYRMIDTATLYKLVLISLDSIVNNMEKVPSGYTHYLIIYIHTGCSTHVTTPPAAGPEGWSPVF